MISQVLTLVVKWPLSQGHITHKTPSNLSKKNAEEKQICVALTVARRKRQFVGQDAKMSHDQ